MSAMKLLTLRVGSLYLWAAALLMLTTATNIGPYTARFGPYYVLGLLLLCGFVFLLRANDMARVAGTPAFVVGAWFHLLLVLAALLSRNGQDLQLAAPMLSGFLVFASAAWFASQLAGHQGRFSWMVALPLVTAAAANYYEYVFDPNVLSTAPGRAAGFFENPNNSGATIAVLWGLWLVSAPRRSWLGATFVGLLSLGAVLVTFSRSALVCFLVVSFIGATILARRQGRSVLRAFGMSLVLVVVSVLVLYLLSDTELSADAQLRVESLMQRRFDDESSLTRGLVAQAYWEKFVEHPFTGSEVLGSLAEQAGLGPHNMFLAIGADFGIVGLGSYLLVLLVGISASLRLGWSSSAGGSAAITCIWLITSSMFSHNVAYSPQGSMVIGLLLGIAAASARRSRPAEPPPCVS